MASTNFPRRRARLADGVWHWLKKRRRIEWVVSLGAVIGILLIAIQGVPYRNAETEILFIVMGIWIVAPMALLPLWLLRRLRNRDTEFGGSSPKGTLTPVRRIVVHLFLLIVALLAARVEIKYGLLPMLGSAPPRYLWNLGLVCIVITLTELSIWRRSKR